MKLVLIFSVLLVVSHQQIDQRRELVWLLPYLPQRIYSSIYQPVYYDRPNHQNDDQLFRQFRPSRPLTYWQNQGMDQSLRDINRFTYGENNYYPDIQSKNKFRQGPSEARFFFGTATTFRNPFLKTATFTLTSTVNLTTVQSCLVELDFVDAVAQATPCRRKRGVLDLLAPPEEAHFSINPSATQPVIPTEPPPSVDQLRENRELATGQLVQHDVISSKENIADEETSEPTVKQLKKKRFLFTYYVASTTVTTYSFFSTTITKTVDLGLDDNQINCLPAGFVVC